MGFKRYWVGWFERNKNPPNFGKLGDFEDMVKA